MLVQQPPAPADIESKMPPVNLEKGHTSRPVSESVPLLLVRRAVPDRSCFISGMAPFLYVAAIIALLVFQGSSFLGSLFSRPFVGYNYPSTPDLILINEFDEPVRCFPNEAKYPIYPPSGSIDIPKSVHSLSLNVTGIAIGKIIIVPTTEYTTAHADAHFHVSDPSVNVSVSSEMKDNGLFINVETPVSSWGYSPCVVAALRVLVPKGAFEKLVDGLQVSAHGMSVGLDLEGDSIGGKLMVSAGSGSIKVANVNLPRDFGIELKDKSGSIAVRNVSGGYLVAESSSGSVLAEKIKVYGKSILSSNSGSIRATNISAFSPSRATSSSGSVDLSSITMPSIESISRSGSVRLSNLIASESIHAQSNSGSVHISNASGGFTSLKLSSSSGSVNTHAIQLDPSKNVSIVGSGHSGSVNLELTSFFGKFHLKKAGSGKVTVKGSNVDFAHNSKTDIIGKRRSADGAFEGNHTLETTGGSGSTRVMFL
ncbi:hypothetical protein HDU67_002871 [Dinochytrium kinnereticum]|nr:hypothetical protein HDU67_002871 [Dinochytrium kinnereticum]